MSRRAKLPKDKAEAKRPLAGKPPKNEGVKVRELEKRLAEALAREAGAVKGETEALGQLQTRNRELAESREQQTAAAEILRVISSSPTDLQPVFDTIARSASQLCNGMHTIVTRFDGELIHLVAQHNPRPDASTAAARLYPRRPGRDVTVGRAILDRTLVHIADVEQDAYFPREVARQVGARSFLAVPMLRDGRPIGAISVSRAETGPFPPDQIGLMQVFADQAVIAIENARLFHELEARNGDLTGALEQQTATGEILRAISSSLIDTAPVFGVIVRNAARLCAATASTINLLDEDSLIIAASHNVPSDLPRRVALVHVPNAIRVIREGMVFHVADAESDPRVTPGALDYIRALGARAFLQVPLKRAGTPVGGLIVYRPAPGAFSESELDVLQTFADQAVIAIENVRLFTELQEKNQALTQAHAQVTEALEQQTATGEILRVISQSLTDVQPVFDTILRNAVRLCGGFYCALFLVDGEMLHFRASHNIPSRALEELNRAYPSSVRDGSTGSTRAVRDRRVVQTLDMQEDPEIPEGSRQRARVIGHRAWIGVPMLREGTAIGTIAVSRSEVKPFSEGEIALLKTFADQAVIAIENVRLFTELQTSNRDLTTALDTQTATADILRVISRSQTDVQPVFDAIIQSAVRLLGGYSGAITRVLGDQIVLAGLTSTDEAGDATLRLLYPLSLDSKRPQVRVIRDRRPMNIVDAQSDPDLPEAARTIATARDTAVGSSCPSSVNTKRSE